MSIWKEIRCDASPEADNCLSKSNLGPKGFQDNKDLMRQAREEGWIVYKHKAVCPCCQQLT